MTKKIMFSDKYGLTDAVLNGNKTQTRRIGKDDIFSIYLKQKEYSLVIMNDKVLVRDNAVLLAVHKLRYKVGEVVPIAQSYKNAGLTENTIVGYDTNIKPIKAKDSKGWNNKMFVCSYFMPHHIKITNVRIEQLQDINDEDCLKEGVVKTGNTYGVKNLYLRDKQFWNAKEAYSVLIDKISGKETWESNPYVFVYDFKLID